MTHRLVEVISPVPAPTDYTVMTEDPREEEVLDVAEAVRPTAVVMMLVVTRHMIKHLLKESRITHTTLVLVKTIIRPCPISTRLEITVKVTTKVRLTTEFEHFEAISHERANTLFPSLAWALDFYASSTLKTLIEGCLRVPASAAPPWLLSSLTRYQQGYSAA